MEDLLQVLQLRRYPSTVTVLVLAVEDDYITVLPVERDGQDWSIAKNGHRHSRTVSELLGMTTRVGRLSRDEFALLQVRHPRMKLERPGVG